MPPIAFIDTEIDPRSHKILDLGGIRDGGETFHSASIRDFTAFLKGARFICGHNILRHDLKYIRHAVVEAGIDPAQVIDTLPLSPLLFPTRPYHALVKDDKLQVGDASNPLNDSVKARDLFFDELDAFHRLDPARQAIFYLLLKGREGFAAFFHFLSFQANEQSPGTLIRETFQGKICEHANLEALVRTLPVELVYCLAWIGCGSRDSLTPPWVLKNYPQVEQVLFLLRNRPCLTGCGYCDQALDIHRGLKHWFGFDGFRSFDGVPLQERTVQAAVDNQSLLAVFPTGGGKSLTFQVPALMSGDAIKGLTVVISPLQSLMKDQVDNLEKAGITDAVTVNGLLDPIERAKSLERVEDGSASLFYISPESLRSKTIERLLLGRKVVRFVIDEAHCFSSWGQDFRVDYLYIGDFIRALAEKKNLEAPIPVSCFTATAKPRVIEDIRTYFREKLALELEVFSTQATRKNLHYNVQPKSDEEEKYQATRDLLLEEKNRPAIVYVSRTRRAYQLAERLSADGCDAKAYHGKMDAQEKTANQDAFLNGKVPIMVATSAFGMGVDKKDVRTVIHYDISDSLENYVQEAGRAGRDESVAAECYVLFNEEDLSKHFILLNQTRLSIKEIQQVWKAIRNLTRFRATVSNSALEIARKAGWDDNIAEIETRVTTAIAALESAGYLKRGQNMPHIFANSILSRTAQEAIDKIMASTRFEEKKKEKAVRIIKKLFSSKSRKQIEGEAAESRIDYISDYLGIVKEEVIDIVNLLREENILADTQDLTAFIKKGENKNRSLAVVKLFSQLETLLFPYLEDAETTLHIKQVNEAVQQSGCTEASTPRIRTLLNFWAIKNWIKSKNASHDRNHVRVHCLQPLNLLKTRMEKRHELATFIVEYLFQKSNEQAAEGEAEKAETLIGFSVHELKDAFQKQMQLFASEATIADIEDTLFYLSRIESIKIEGGFLVVYNRLTIDRVEQDNKKQYKNEDYEQLNQFYENKVQQIHIVGEYARKMIGDYQGALQFVEDYFQLNYPSFLTKYFPGSRRDELKMPLTPAKFSQLFGALSAPQLKIIRDPAQYIVVAAGPGSGKTRVLVHKLASLLLMEDVKHEQLLMLTFSRAAATEFKKRLLALIGNAALYIEIKTFHSYCFDLLGKVGSLEKSNVILRAAVEKIRLHEVDPSRITKTVLVIDEAQDMNADEYALIEALMEQNEGMRVIAVGDDDQNIYEFRGADAVYLHRLLEKKQAVKHELIENYRSEQELVDFTNTWAQRIGRRLKETPVVALRAGRGHIRIVHHRGDRLIVPLVHDLRATDLHGTICVLTQTNDEALQITGLLRSQGMPAKLIQSNEGFSLYDLCEIRYFLKQVQREGKAISLSQEAWDAAKNALKTTFVRSENRETCEQLIRDFEAVHPKKKFLSDLEVFLRESKLEDFAAAPVETIRVSTIHKAKGQEFYHVFLMLAHFAPYTDEKKRQLYVAMTRAKSRLTIHLDGAYLDDIPAVHTERVNDPHLYDPPAQLTLHPSLKDVWLDHFQSRQGLIQHLMSGDALIPTPEGCVLAGGQFVLRFSKGFLPTLEKLQQQGYRLRAAKINHVVYWKKEGDEQEIRIVLPELVFET